MGKIASAALKEMSLRKPIGREFSSGLPDRKSVVARAFSELRSASCQVGLQSSPGIDAMQTAAWRLRQRLERAEGSRHSQSERIVKCSPLFADAISQKTFVADDSHFFQRTANAAWKEINGRSGKRGRVFPAKKKWRDRQIQLIDQSLLEQ